MAFSGIEQPELRITFDTNLRFRTDELDLRLGSHGAPLLMPDEVLMELKIPGVCPMWLSRLLSETGAVIVCDGADDAAVRLSIIKAVEAFTGFSSDSIQVIKTAPNIGG